MTRRLIRQMHPAAYRRGEWAELLPGRVTHARTGNLCYAVRFPDGATDFWAVGDSDAGFEFANEAPMGILGEGQS